MQEMDFVAFILFLRLELSHLKVGVSRGGPSASSVYDE